VRVSVAMATCEGERFVEEQLESIARQSRPPDEIVVYDDASADSTLSRVESVAARTGAPIRVERNSERLGITRNFERAIESCRGDGILLADSTRGCPWPRSRGRPSPISGRARAETPAARPRAEPTVSRP
jgi:glycosyltransferase involved in cell wall biosynthesis